MSSQETGYDRVWVNPSDMWMHWLNNSETLNPSIQGLLWRFNQTGTIDW